MHIFARESAKLGHWKAKLLLAEIYLQRPDGYCLEFRPEQSRAYINEFMEQGVPEAFYFMSQR